MHNTRNRQDARRLLQSRERLRVVDLNRNPDAVLGRDAVFELVCRFSPNVAQPTIEATQKSVGVHLASSVLRVLEPPLQTVQTPVGNEADKIGVDCHQQDPHVEPHAENLLRHFSAVGGVGRFTSSLGCRGTMRPPGSRTSTMSTVSLLGSWNDEVFNGSTDYLPGFAGHQVDDTIACTKRAPRRHRPCAPFRSAFVERALTRDTILSQAFTKLRKRVRH